MLYEAVVSLLGEVPQGFAPVLYCICAVILLWLLQTVFAIIFQIVNWIGGK